MHILIIEDNITIAENISLYFRAKGYQTSAAHDGESAFDMINFGSYDFLIIDRMIPRIDGLSLVRLLQSRKIHIPFLFLTALSKQVDKIEGLSLGADDYLVKPFDLEELALRIENILKRGGSKIVTNSIVRIGDITVDMIAKKVLKNEKYIELSPKEYALLELLVSHRGIVQTRESLYETIWGDEYDIFSNVLETINVHIAHLRRKLGSDIIRTVKLVGYVIDSES